MSDGSASYQHEVVSVEHVMPQQPAPNSQWAAWVPDKSQHQLWVHRLGNLALLSRKRTARPATGDFSWKKSAYFTKGGSTAFALTTQVLQFSDWTAAVMQQRQDEMLAKLEAHWRLQGRKARPPWPEALLAELEEAGDAVLFELESARHGLTAAAKTGRLHRAGGLPGRLDWSGQPHSRTSSGVMTCTAGALKLSDDGTSRFHRRHAV